MGVKSNLKNKIKPERAIYPKPKKTGGALIREVIAFLKVNGKTLPLNSHIQIAVSGGLDSLALAHLLIKYGRRIEQKSKITIFHINHHWRGKESEDDAVFVMEFAKNLGIPCRQINFPKNQTLMKGVSLEESARLTRKKIYSELVEEGMRRQSTQKTFIFTAHHADDVAETMLWRLFTGAALSHGGGINFQEGNEIRPFLRVRKSILKTYLQEEGISWREDRTNHEGRFLRSKMRLKLLPVIEHLFPRAVEHLVKAALRAQNRTQDSNSQLTPDFLFSAVGLKTRRIHREILQNEKIIKNKKGELHLPGSWRLYWNKTSKHERWVLEKIRIS